MELYYSTQCLDEVRWCQRHESMNLYTIDVGIIAWGMLSWHTLVSFISLKDFLNATTYLDIAADMWYQSVNINPHLKAMFPTHFRIHAMINWGCNDPKVKAVPRMLLVSVYLTHIGLLVFTSFCLQREKKYIGNHEVMN